MSSLDFFWNWYKIIVGWAGGIMLTLIILNYLISFVVGFLERGKCRKCGKWSFGLAAGLSYRCVHCKW